MAKESKSPNYFPELPYDYLQSALDGNLNTSNGYRRKEWSILQLYKCLEEKKANIQSLIRTAYELEVIDNVY